MVQFMLLFHIYIYIYMDKKISHKIMKCAMCMVYKFILIYFFNVKHKYFIF